MLKYKHIEAAREVRLWIGQILVPAAGILIAVPETREMVNEKIKQIKRKFKGNEGS